MIEIKQLYALEWLGPYNSIEDMLNDDNVINGSIYLITGRQKYERAKHIKYIGITERDPAVRLSDKDHKIKQEQILEKKYWVGVFSRVSNRNLRKHAELIETLFIRYLYLNDVKIINKVKLKKEPKCAVVVVNRWNKDIENHRLYKPSLLSELPDLLIYDGSEYWGTQKLKFLVAP